MCRHASVTRQAVPSQAEHMANTPAGRPPIRPGEWNCYSQQNRSRRDPEKHFHSAIHKNLLGERERPLVQLVSVATSPLHPQVAPTRKKVTRTGQAEQRSKTGTTAQRATVSLHRIAIIETGCSPTGRCTNPVILLGDMIVRTGCCARRVLGTNTHRSSINH